MDERLKKLKGSPSRDAFKHWHKNDLDGSFYASDLDLVLIGGSPAHIIAALDYKESRDSITWTEAVLYNELTDKGIEIYIVQRSPLSHKHLDIYLYIHGNTKVKPVKCELRQVAGRLNVKEFESWERELRRKNK